MTDGLIALMQKHAEELEREQAAHRDALALCEVYEQRIAELETVLSETQRECGNLSAKLAVAGQITTWVEVDQLRARIAELESAYKGLLELNNSQAVNLLSGMVFGYRPQFSKSGGYKCMFCGATIRVSADIARAKYHTEICIWIRARAWLDALEQRPSAQDGTVTDGG